MQQNKYIFKRTFYFLQKSSSLECFAFDTSVNYSHVSAWNPNLLLIITSVCWESGGRGVTRSIGVYFLIQIYQILSDRFFILPQATLSDVKTKGWKQELQCECQWFCVGFNLQVNPANQDQHCEFRRAKSASLQYLSSLLDWTTLDVLCIILHISA